MSGAGKATRTRRGRIVSLRTRAARALLCTLALCALCAAGAACAGTAAPKPAAPETTPAKSVPPAPADAEPYTIALDAGHGGMDSGAQSLVTELTVCEDTVDALYALLERDAHYRPVRTRPNGEDRSTADRVRAAADSGAVLLLSIHANYDGDTRQSHGFECFPTPPGRACAAQSLRFAQRIAERMAAAGHRLRGESGIRYAYYSGRRKQIVDSTDTRVRTLKSFGVVERAPCPAVLAEQCFISNRRDVEMWTGAAGCARAARAYYEAICAYFGTEPLP